MDLDRLRDELDWRENQERKHMGIEVITAAGVMLVAALSAALGYFAGRETEWRRRKETWNRKLMDADRR
jgi:hypothetical protein